MHLYDIRRPCREAFVSPSKTRHCRLTMRGVSTAYQLNKCASRSDVSETGQRQLHEFQWLTITSTITYPQSKELIYLHSFDKHTEEIFSFFLL